MASTASTAAASGHDALVPKDHGETTCFACCHSRAKGSETVDEARKPAPGFWYRASTSWTALKALYTLPPEKVDTFLRSYEIFDQERITGQNNDQGKIVNYYEVLNHLCAVGEVEKMYIPAIIDPKAGIFTNQLLFERKMAADIAAKPGQRVLDIGCGRGRIAHHVASITGAHVTGINIDPSQIARAKDYAEKTGMSGQLEFKVHNYNEPLPFEDGSFDAMYQVQAFTYASDMVGLFKEINRVLKPGAKISFLDWVKLDKFNPEDPHHKDLLARVKPLIGAVNTPSPQDFVSALEQAGFAVLANEDASVGGHQYPLISFAENFFEGLQGVVGFMCRAHVFPKHLGVLFDRFTKDGEAFVEADKLGLFTTSWQIVAQKPLAA